MYCRYLFLRCFCTCFLRASASPVLQNHFGALSSLALLCPCVLALEVLHACLGNFLNPPFFFAVFPSGACPWQRESESRVVVTILLNGLCRMGVFSSSMIYMYWRHGSWTTNVSAVVSIRSQPRKASSMLCVLVESLALTN